MRGNIKEISNALDKAKDIKPLAVKNGMQIVSYEDAIILNQLEMLDDAPDMGERKFNPDGTLARSKKKIASINVDTLFLNRYRKVAGKKYQVVIDYRAIKEQSSGVVYAKNIVAYEIGRDKDTDELKLIKVVNVSDDEFVSEFTHKLDIPSMVRIRHLLGDADANLTEDTLDI